MSCLLSACINLPANDWRVKELTSHPHTSWLRLAWQVVK